MAALGNRFRTTGAPRQITSLHPVGLGDRATRGAGHFAQEGMLKRIICGTFVDSPPISEMAAADKIEAYTLPQGALSQLMREMASGRPGLFTKTGLHTLVDPRHGGGKQSKRTTEDLVELVTLKGEEWLFLDRKSTRLNSSHVKISYAVFCLKKKRTQRVPPLAP